MASPTTSGRFADPPRIRNLVLGAGCLVLAFAFISIAVILGDTVRVDETILLMLRNPSDLTKPVGPPWLWEVGRDITALGSLSALSFVTVMFVGYLLIAKSRIDALLVLLIVLGGEALNTTLKHAFDRSRPEISQSVRVFTASFPSGHATMSAVTFLTIALVMAHRSRDLVFRRYFLSVAIFLSGVIGLSRLYLGVHYPSDVLAGWCVGAAWAILCWNLFWFFRRNV